MLKRRLIIDVHSDTLSKALDENKSLDYKGYSFNTFDIKNKLPYIQFLASYIAPRYIGNKNSGFDRVNKLLDKFYNYYMLNKENIIVIKGKKDIKEVMEKNKLGIVLTVENGSAIGNKLSNVDFLYQRGIRLMSITWNNDNEFGCGALTSNDLGLTSLGKEYVKKLNEKDIIIDVSHLSFKSFFDVVNIATKPIVATHSCVYNLCNNVRNLNDAQIKEIAKLNGVIGVCFYKKFLTNNKIAYINDIVNHIEYISNLVGIEYVGLGSDFDGIDKEDLPINLKGVKDIDNIFFEMKRRGFSKEEIEKVASKNFLRILNSSLR